ncbi:MAG: ATP/GTP-binding protein [Ruminococcus sp.]|nr:ATP/GTP-binding protein [Ruminococcus sp.]
MRHQRFNPDFQFVKEPEHFNKYTDRELLQYCLGATMYMPGTKDFLPKIMNCAMPGLTTMVFCFEDACAESDVPAAEENVLRTLDAISTAIENGDLQQDDIPLIFCRIRSLEQFKSFAQRLTPHMAKALTGINFPKFNSENGDAYFAYLKALSADLGEVLYGMPIIEDPRVAFKESRMQELMSIRAILNKYYDMVLQIRVGGTDFSSCFGVRRGVDYSIYDIMTVRECLVDILNVFSRNNEFVVSGPVWEYFRASKRMMFEELPKHTLDDYLMKRIPLVNHEIDGLMREVILDKANGFVGRTVIHPSHIRFVNGLQAVTREEYEDAKQILESTEGGVHKGQSANKMNEIKPHTNWANKVMMRARAFGVIENEKNYLMLISDQTA